MSTLVTRQKSNKTVYQDSPLFRFLCLRRLRFLSSSSISSSSSSSSTMNPALIRSASSSSSSSSSDESFSFGSPCIRRSSPSSESEPPAGDLDCGADMTPETCSTKFQWIGGRCPFSCYEQPLLFATTAITAATASCSHCLLDW